MAYVTRSRGHESPMDFQYDSGGPVVAESPFQQAASLAYQNMPGSFDTPYMTPSTSLPIRMNSSAYSHVAESPSNGRGTSVNTPLIINSALDEDVEMLSSPISPSYQRGTPTPVVNIADDYNKTQGTEPKGKENRLFSSFNRNSGSRSSPLGQIFNAISGKKKPPKKSPSKSKKRKDSFDELGSDDEESDDDGDEWRKTVVKETIMWSPRKTSSSRVPSPRKTSRSVSIPEESAITHVPNSSLLAVLSHHDNLPYVFASYLQLIFNLFLVLVMFYLIMSFILMIRHDIARKVEESVAEAEAVIAQCGRQYVTNRCELRLPAFEAQCAEWTTCMNSDSNAVGRASIGAKTIAGIVNSFVEPISYKTMMFVLVLIFGSLYVSSSKVPAPAAPNPQLHIPEPKVRERVIYRGLTEKVANKGELMTT